MAATTIRQALVSGHWLHTSQPRIPSIFPIPTPTQCPLQDTFLELRDGSQFTNHSECPAITGSDSGEGELPSSDVCTARIDIKAGQELTDHYGFYASEDIKSWVDPLMQKYCPGQDVVGRWIGTGRIFPS